MASCKYCFIACENCNKGILTTGLLAANMVKTDVLAANMPATNISKAGLSIANVPAIGIPAIGEWEMPVEKNWLLNGF